LPRFKIYDAQIRLTVVQFRQRVAPRVQKLTALCAEAERAAAERLERPLIRLLPMCGPLQANPGLRSAQRGGDYSAAGVSPEGSTFPASRGHGFPDVMSGWRGSDSTAPM
jgi:hypothetical protein